MKDQTTAETQADIVRMSNAFQRLWEEDDFKIFQEYAQNLVDTWGTQLATPARDMMDFAKGEFCKGVIFGVQQLMNAKSAMIAARGQVVAPPVPPNSTPAQDDEVSEAPQPSQGSAP